MSAIFRLIRLQGLKQGITYVTPQRIPSRTINTSSKKNEIKKQTQSFEPKKTWVSYGFFDDDKEYDRHAMHQTLFVTITICLVGGIFIFSYLPDTKMRDWAQREAFLRLRYREEHGLPPIDPNLIDPAKIHLPSDEELGDTEIII